MGIIRSVGLVLQIFPVHFYKYPGLVGVQKTQSVDPLGSPSDCGGAVMEMMVWP